MEDIINQIFNVKIRTELEAYGSKLIEKDIIDFVEFLPERITIAKVEYDLSEEIKKKLVQQSKRQFGFTSGQHIYIKGAGIYNDSDEIELDKENWHFYQRHKHYLHDVVYKTKPEIVNSLDYETDQIIKKFPRPNDTISFHKKGLVIGYVQSGKTANFTHLISKASSIGYRFIIVLAGMTDTLRMQTQFRLDKELCGNNTLGIVGLETVKWLPGEEKFNSLTGLPDKRIKKDNGDFYIPVKNFTDHFDNTNDVTIAIIKKLARNNGERFGSVIGQLINWIDCRYDKSTEKMPPVLIIDDEADQASIDSADEDADPTVINHAIRKLVSLFPKSVYVGYTATPFANVFTNPANEFLGLEDLYPKDFIYALPEPEDYFGSTKFFSVKNKNKELAFIEYVEEDEKIIINDEGLEITENLINSIFDFLFSIIIRNFRCNDAFCGMMIHTDHRNQYQNTVYSKVKEFFDNLTFKPKYYDDFNAYVENSRSIGRLQGIISEYPNYDLDKFKTIFNTVKDKLKKSRGGKTINIRVINSKEDKLNYLTEDLQYLICIGGNIMSRGVTIEGLTITYYLRDAMKYDTLLQMGRWFGFRKGYEDLLRIYTTKNIADNFEFVMAVEDDLRNEVNRYIEEGLTPIDFAPKVRAHMKMQPTAKMGNASQTKSYSQQAVQTIYFDRDLDVLRKNYMIGEQLIDKYKKQLHKTLQYDYKFIIKNADTNDLTKFIEEYGYTEYNSFNVKDIIKYINVRIQAGEIQNFDIILSGIKKRKAESDITRLAGIELNPVKRNLRKSKGKEYINENIVNIGVISDTADIKIADENKKLTLILYYIDHNCSDGFNESDVNYNADYLDFNSLGFTVVFPKTNVSNGELNYYQQIFE